MLSLTEEQHSVEVPVPDVVGLIGIAVLVDVALHLGINSRGCISFQPENVQCQIDILNNGLSKEYEVANCTNCVNSFNKKVQRYSKGMWFMQKLYNLKRFEKIASKFEGIFQAHWTVSSSLSLAVVDLVLDLDKVNEESHDLRLEHQHHVA